VRRLIQPPKEKAATADTTASEDDN